MVIRTQGLTKRYGHKIACDTLTFAVPPAEIFGFLGPNGAGKSTCVKMLTGLVVPSEGGGEVLGRPLGDVRARQKLGYLPEQFRYQPWMTGWELLRFHMGLYGMKYDPGRAEQCLRLTGLWGQEKHKVGGYSKGMQQRVGLACALLPEPELLFLDEPTSALDPVGRKEVRDILVYLKSRGAAIFLNSHLLSEVESVCDRAAIIARGHVVRQGRLNELLRETVSVQVRAEPCGDALLAELRARFDGGLTQTAEGALQLTLADGEDVPRLAAFLVGQGVALRELTPRRESLETVFLRAVEEAAL